MQNKTIDPEYITAALIKLRNHKIKQRRKPQSHNHPGNLQKCDQKLKQTTLAPPWTAQKQAQREHERPTHADQE
eukprot:c2930_g1_i1 orf=3-221(-)